MTDSVEDLVVNVFVSITNFFDIITLDYKYNGVANPVPKVAVRLVFCHLNNA